MLGNSSMSEEMDPNAQSPCDPAGGAAESPAISGDPPEAITATPRDDGSYDVTWTVHIALAVPRVKEDVPAADAKERKNVQSDVVKPLGCYHVEYNLPRGTAAVKVDLIVYAAIAKLYKEDEMKVLILQHEGEQTWAGWTQTFTVRVDRDMIISLLSQKIKIQIWNTKNKISSRAWTNRFVAFRFAHAQVEDSAECGKHQSGQVTASTGSSWTNMSITQTLLFTAALVSKKTKEAESPAPTAEDLKNMKRNNTASVEISVTPLLAGDMLLTECFSVWSSGIHQLICGVALDKPFISDQLKAELNPLVITILSASSMPSSPVPFHVLEENCLPVFCQYKLLDLKKHTTKYQRHGATVRFNDKNVVLVGLMSSVDLLELLTGPPLEIEVHDRDRKLANPRKTPAQFEEQSGPCSVRRRFKRKTNACNSYGVARINLSELLLGKRRLQLDLQIKRSPPPQNLNRKRRKAACGASTDSMPQGHYFDSNLKVRIEISRPLNFKNDSGELLLYDSPFGRIVYLFAHSNVSVMTRLRLEILRINAAAFHLSSYSQETIEKVLPHYKMDLEQRKSTDLDFVSGFHVLDKKMNIFVLEGLKHKAVRRLWENVPPKQSGGEDEQVTVLYNSRLTFAKRTYDSLNVGLTPIHLCEPLESIMRRPLVYVRHLLPRSCFQALSRLNQLCQVRQLKEALQCDLLPSAGMVLSLSQEYGGAPGPITPPSTQQPEDTQSNNESSVSCFILQDNIRSVHEASEGVQKLEPLLKLEHSTERSAHNYSIQTFNSNRLAKEALLKEMEKVPGRRFTYSQQYQGATVETGDARSKPGRPSSGPAVWTTSIDRKSLNRPDEARVEELRKPWRENVLHANTLKPTLMRDTWTGAQRSQDFQLHSKPPPLSSSAPVSIHLAGQRLQKEQLEAAGAQYGRWLNLMNVMIGDGRVPEFKCHMATSVGKLEDILKDEFRKYSLRRPGMLLQRLPNLSVLSISQDDAGVKEKKKTAQDQNASSPNKKKKKKKKKKVNGESFQYKRAALPLTEEERSIFAFHSCPPQRDTQRSAARPFRKIMEVRTHKDTTWFTQ
ncbi:uncharacterized protein cfap92 [Genypterus blacodes]|uniref:uncharacterized protein cfap92 n=1 Tax=Genypterus blacodes TaxID=154954 RepID=UPI003F76D005